MATAGTERDSLLSCGSVQVVPAHTSGPLVDAFLAGKPPCPCFLGVSVRNKMGNGSRLEVLIPWVLQRTHALTVVIGDHLHRHNLIALDDMGIATATQKAFAMGRRAKRAALRILENRPDCRVVSSADLTETPGCKRVTEAVTDYYASEPLFMADVTAEVLAFLDRSTPSPHSARPSRCLNILKDYVLEEIAMFLNLYDELGHAIEVYPGPDLPIMRKIAAGRYTGFPVQCPCRTHISVQVGLPKHRDTLGE